MSNLTEREAIYAADPERERLAMLKTTGRPRGRKDSQPRKVTSAVLASIEHARAVQTPEHKRKGRMALEARRRSEIARKAAQARWQTQTPVARRSA
jgi:hypothetical protein